MVAARKREHIEIAASDGARGPLLPGWDDIRLLPAAFPEVGLDDVQLSTELLGRPLGAPLVISGMTGGHPAASDVNATLASVAEELGLAIGVGSQRAALLDPNLRYTYAVVRERAPTAFVIANVGASQLVDQRSGARLGPERLAEAVEMVSAQALAIHFNFVEEMVQTEGDRATLGIAAALRAAVETTPVPLIAKETGSGLSREGAQALVAAGVAALDVGGAGGTSFAAVERARAERHGDGRGARLGRTFGSWGVPTAMAVLECRGLGLPVIATGGIATGLDAAKALALGADAVGIGRVALQAALRGEDALREELGALLEELRVACLLCGVARPADLSGRPYVLLRHLGEWQRQRGRGEP